MYSIGYAYFLFQHYLNIVLQTIYGIHISISHFYVFIILCIFTLL